MTQNEWLYHTQLLVIIVEEKNRKGLDGKLVEPSAFTWSAVGSLEILMWEEGLLDTGHRALNPNISYQIEEVCENKRTVKWRLCHGCVLFTN